MEKNGLKPMSTINRTPRKTRSKARLTANGATDKLVPRTTQVYEHQWVSLALMAQFRGLPLAEIVREALDQYITIRGLRPAMLTELKKFIQTEITGLVGQHIQASADKARLEIEATQGTLQTLTEQLAIVLTHLDAENAAQRTELGQIKKDNTIQRREIDQVITFLESKNAPIKRG